MGMRGFEPPRNYNLSVAPLPSWVTCPWTVFQLSIPSLIITSKIKFASEDRIYISALETKI